MSISALPLGGTSRVPNSLSDTLMLDVDSSGHPLPSAEKDANSANHIIPSYLTAFAKVTPAAGVRIPSQLSGTEGNDSVAWAKPKGSFTAQGQANIKYGFGTKLGLLQVSNKSNQPQTDAGVVTLKEVVPEETRSKSPTRYAKERPELPSNIFEDAGSYFFAFMVPTETQKEIGALVASVAGEGAGQFTLTEGDDQHVTLYYVGKAPKGVVSYMLEAAKNVKAEPIDFQVLGVKMAHSEGYITTRGIPVKLEVGPDNVASQMRSMKEILVTQLNEQLEKSTDEGMYDWDRWHETVYWNHDRMINQGASHASRANSRRLYANKSMSSADVYSPVEAYVQGIDLSPHITIGRTAPGPGQEAEQALKEFFRRLAAIPVDEWKKIRWTASPGTDSGFKLLESVGNGHYESVG